MRYIVRRLDENPKNTHTYNTWVYISEFPTLRDARAYVNRASAPSQLLRIEEIPSEKGKPDDNG